MNYISAEEAIKAIKPGQRVFVHGGAATPHYLLKKLAERSSELWNVEIVSISLQGDISIADKEFKDSFRINSLFVSERFKYKKMESTKKDILQREDVELLVNKFYDKVKTDELLGPVFSHVDWPNHLPTIYNFWASMLLSEQTYRGNPLQKHLSLPIEPEHFNRWLMLFKQTADENFAGEKVEEVKMRAQSIAGIFQLKMGLTKPEDAY